MSIEERLKKRLALFGDNDSLIGAVVEIMKDEENGLSCKDIYIIHELIDNASGLYNLAQSGIREVKALERKQEKDKV